MKNIYMVSKQIGQILKEKRMQLNVSPKEIASELGISARAYLDIESGTVDIKASKLIVLKELLKISVAEMFSEQNSRNSNIVKNEPSAANIGPQYISKDLLDKISELYERIIEIEKNNKT